MTLELFMVEHGASEPAGPWRQDQIDEARAFAREHSGKLIAYIFEFSDSELVEDYSDSEEDGDER